MYRCWALDDHPNLYGRYRGDLQPIGTVLSLDCPQLCLNLFHPVAEVGEVIRGDVQRAYAEAQRYLVDHRRLLFCRQIPILEFSVQLYLYIPYIPYRYSCTGFQYLTIFRVMRCPPVTAHPFCVLTLYMIHQSKALGLSIPTLYGTSSAELIQCRSSSQKCY